jgi:hypothetical protein
MIVERGVPRASLPKGSVLRSVMRQPAPSGGGPSLAVTTTTEFTELTHASIDASVFAVSSANKTVDLRDQIRQMPAGRLDSALTTNMARVSQKAAKTLCNGGRGSSPPR